MSNYVVNDYFGSTNIFSDKETFTTKDLKIEILKLRPNLLYENLILFQSNSKLSDNINIYSLNNKNFTLCIVPIKCDVH